MTTALTVGNPERTVLQLWGSKVLDRELPGQPEVEIERVQTSRGRWLGHVRLLTAVAVVLGFHL